MKQLIWCVLFTAIALQGKAQFQIGGAIVPSGGRAGKLRDDDVDRFKHTTTVFLLQTKDKPRLADFEKAIGSVWTITPFKVVTLDGLDALPQGQYTYFGFGGYIVNTPRGGSSTHIFYELLLPDYNSAGEQKGFTLLGRFVLSPDMAALASVSGKTETFESKAKREKRQDRETHALYTRANYANWGPGQIKGYLKSINDYLLQGKRRGIFDEIVEEDKLKALSKDTLFLPEYVKDRLNPFTGDEVTKDDDDAIAETSAAYTFPYRYIREEELEQRIVSATKPIYHLIYVRSSSGKYVSVVEGMSGTIVYSQYVNASYNFKMKDLKKLANNIN